MSKTPTDEVSWTVPRRWHVQGMWRGLRGTLTPGFFARVIGVSGAITLGAWYFVEKEYGPTGIPWAKYIGMIVLVGLLALVYYVLSSLAILPQVLISPKGIRVFNGQALRLIPFDELSDISIRESAIPILNFRHEAQEHEWAIADSVDLEQLRRVIESHSGRAVTMESEG